MSLDEEESKRVKGYAIQKVLSIKKSKNFLHRQRERV